ncbi:integrase core domain-containing protein [Streptomyces sp. NRRL WC-3618]|uniref:integrase core domain-containing protein n=1 Tax=Streptomyces sp. NRRL WC-3618 TaxID=1519490 RepID=UPI0018FEE456|nr:integrase core domain-containing protein [Streptomyces sp. NRRL WC-3618]
MQRPIELAEYTSEAYNNLCDHLDVVQSMGRVGSALDNAAAESFNSLIKVEYIHRRRFATRTEARLKIATWITGFYHPRRRHSAAGGLPPEEFERIIAEARGQHGQEDQAA